MPRSKKRPFPEIDALLEELLIDAHGEDEQLGPLHEGITEAFTLPMHVHVVGEPVSLVAIDYDGNPGCGIMGRCRRSDGSGHRITFADMQLAADAPGYAHLAAYCSWLGIEPGRALRGGAHRTQTVGTAGFPPQTGARAERCTPAPAQRNSDS